MAFKVCKLCSKGLCSERSSILWSQCINGLLLEFEPYVSGEVSCGNHNAISCSECPQGNGFSWCNGQCEWLNEECIWKGILFFLKF